MDVSTKLHRLMHHIDHHLVYLDCIRRGSSVDNDMEHTEFKVFMQLQRNILIISPPGAENMGR